MEGEYLTVILDNINLIYSLIVSPESRKIYYVIVQYQNGERYAIHQCNMDGSDDVNLIYEDEVVESLTLDTITNRLYFMKNNRKIFYFHLKTNETKLVNTFYGEKNDDKFIDIFITSLEVYKNSIYFGENSMSSIRMCNKENCHEPEIYRNNTANIKQLRILSLTSEKDSIEISGCFLHEQGKEKKCDHLCIPKGKFDFL